MILTSAGLAVLDRNHDRVLSRWVEEIGTLDGYDPRIRRLLAPMLPKDGWAVDGGAFLGSHTVVYAEAVGPHGRVFSFEPMPSHFECLRHNAENFLQVQFVPMALYSEPCTLWLSPNPINAGATVVGSPDDAGAIEVRGTPLDAFDFLRLDFIKLDVEGLVLRALEGADRTLRLHRPVVVAEVGNNLQLFGDFTEDVIAFMEERGYKAEELPPIEGTENSPDQCDMLFIPKERAG